MGLQRTINDKHYPHGIKKRIKKWRTFQGVQSIPMLL